MFEFTIGWSKRFNGLCLFWVFFLKMFDKKLSSNDWHIQKVEMNHQVYDIETMLADSAFREHEEEQDSSLNTALPEDKAALEAKEQEQKEKGNIGMSFLKRSQSLKALWESLCLTKKKIVFMAKAIATGILPAMYGRAIGTLELKIAGFQERCVKMSI